MSDQHPPVQVPIELIREWCGIKENGSLPSADLMNAFRKAAQWGSDLRQSVNEAQLQEARDQQLDECCQWLAKVDRSFCAGGLRNALRPKVDDSEAADAARMRWILQGNGYFMEEQGLCGHGPCDEQEINDARREIDKRMTQDAGTSTSLPAGTVKSDDPRIWNHEARGSSGSATNLKHGLGGSGSAVGMSEVVTKYIVNGTIYGAGGGSANATSNPPQI